MDSRLTGRTAVTILLSLLDHVTGFCVLTPASAPAVPRNFSGLVPVSIASTVGTQAWARCWIG